MQQWRPSAAKNSFFKKLDIQGLLALSQAKNGLQITVWDSQSAVSSIAQGFQMATHSSIPALENPMDRGVWQATIHGAAKIGTGLSY